MTYVCDFLSCVLSRPILAETSVRLMRRSASARCRKAAATIGGPMVGAGLQNCSSLFLCLPAPMLCSTSFLPTMHICTTDLHTIRYIQMAGANFGVVKTLQVAKKLDAVGWQQQCRSPQHACPAAPHTVVPKLAGVLAPTISTASCGSILLHRAYAGMFERPTKVYLLNESRCDENTAAKLPGVSQVAQRDRCWQAALGTPRTYTPPVSHLDKGFCKPLAMAKGMAYTVVVPLPPLRTPPPRY